MNIKTLLPNNLEAQLLTEWIERGAFDALERRVSLFLAINACLTVSLYSPSGFIALT